MATARKRWFAVADDILMEDWDDNTVASFVRLTAYLNTRRARGQLDGENAYRATLSSTAVCLVMRKKRLDYARLALSKLATKAGLSVSYEGDSTSIFWPKCAEIQGWSARETPPPTPNPNPSPKPSENPPQNSSSSAPPQPEATKPKKRRKPPEPDAPPLLTSSPEPSPDLFAEPPPPVPRPPPGSERWNLPTALFPGFVPLPAAEYERMASAAGNVLGEPIDPQRVAEWHAWQWCLQGLAEVKPAGRKLSLKNRWKFLGRFHGGSHAELAAAAKWVAGVRLTESQRLRDIEYANRPQQTPEQEAERMAAIMYALTKNQRNGGAKVPPEELRRRREIRAQRAAEQDAMARSSVLGDAW